MMKYLFIILTTFFISCDSSTGIDNIKINHIEFKDDEDQVSFKWNHIFNTKMSDKYHLSSSYFDKKLVRYHHDNQHITFEVPKYVHISSRVTIDIMHGDDIIESKSINLFRYEKAKYEMYSNAIYDYYNQDFESSMLRLDSIDIDSIPELHHDLILAKGFNLIMQNNIDEAISVFEDGLIHFPSEQFKAGLTYIHYYHHQNYEETIKEGLTILDQNEFYSHNFDKKMDHYDIRLLVILSYFNLGYLDEATAQIQVINPKFEINDDSSRRQDILAELQRISIQIK